MSLRIYRGLRFIGRDILHLSAAEDLEAKMEAVGFGKGYRYYALGLLTVVYVFNFIDRQIVVILQESIKQDLGLMDWQLGMLSGFAFAVFYVIMGIPIARIADKGSRRNVISVSLALWSVMTALCGFVGNFWQLLLARIGVGVGEAGCSPPAHSIISDMFPVQQRATALSTYNMGINFGVLIGFLAGGWINEYLGWRQAFIFVGIPGVLFAVFVRLTLKEPPRGMSEVKPVSTEAPDLSDVFRLLWDRVSFRHMVMAAGLHAFVSYGVGGWMAPFLQRVHELGSGDRQLVSTGGRATCRLGCVYGWLLLRQIWQERCTIVHMDTRMCDFVSFTVPIGRLLSG